MSKKTIRIYPVPGVTLHPWRPVPQEVTVAEWAELQRARPRPFTDKPPGAEPERHTESEEDSTGGTD